MFIFRRGEGEGPQGRGLGLWDPTLSVSRLCTVSIHAVPHALTNPARKVSCPHPTEEGVRTPRKPAVPTVLGFRPGSV